MTYEYVYRNNDGAMVHDIIEADSRSKAFSAIKSKGIAPVSMHECPNGRPSVGARTHIRYRLPILITLVVALVAVSCWWFLCNNSGEGVCTVPKVKRNALIKEAGNRPRVTGADTEQSISSEASHDKNGLQAEASPPMHVNAASSGSPDSNEQERPKPVFDNASDQLLAMATSGRPGVPMPPLPIAGQGADMMFMASLDKPIEILDTDSEAVRAVKQRVIDTRAEVKALMEKGLSFQEIMREHQGLVNDNASIRTKAMIEARAILEGGDQEGAETYIRTMNHAFAEMGIEPIRMPGKKYGKYSQGKKKAVEAAKNSKEEPK